MTAMSRFLSISIAGPEGLLSESFCLLLQPTLGRVLAHSSPSLSKNRCTVKVCFLNTGHAVSAILKDCCRRFTAYLAPSLWDSNDHFPAVRRVEISVLNQALLCQVRP